MRQETSRMLKFSDFVSKRYLCKASKDGDDRAVIEIARECQSSGFVRNPKGEKMTFLEIQPVAISQRKRPESCSFQKLFTKFICIRPPKMVMIGL